MVLDSPASSDIDFVVARATAARRNRHRRNPEFSHLTDAAIVERVTGILTCPRPGHDGWWLAGYVFDTIAEAEFEVWFIPGCRRLGLSERTPMTTIPSPPRESAIYFNGERRKWIDRETGAVVPDPHPR